ncbi:NAD(P)/FAD-dependent oxidoreductase [Methylovulum psychrotolerans]|uniref:Oxidoreductase n=1 Tax=Methylovulum psychrotolerans TaxID=1704499 RepID=A0A2S5CJ33_9GAMM|nr:FAD-dependent monooxygenase [Methylovulum psychrotolerans]POZ50752.1 oxidoreductase [Methylovulum psychrotolerans]
MRRYLSATPKNKRVEWFDAVIVGAGPAGAATALTLAKAGQRVLLADAASKAFRIGEGLPPSARSLLRELGVLENFLADGHRLSHGSLSAWGSAQLHCQDFFRHLQGQGYQLDRRRFEQLLWVAVCAAGAELRQDTRIEVLAHPPGQDFALNAHQSGLTVPLQCRWLVDAGGRRSRIARGQGSTRHAADRLAAFYSVLQTTEAGDYDGRTWLEATPAGWWYSALLPTGGRLVAYLTDLDLADKRQLLSVAGFTGHLAQTRHLSALCAQHRYAVCTKPQGVDASSGRLDQFIGRQWLAVGDAALSFDPLSSQGIANALYTGIQAGQAITAALNGNPQAPVAYARHLGDIYQAYLQNRHYYYGLENRWAELPFWRRRGVVTALTG